MILPAVNANCNKHFPLKLTSFFCESEHVEPLAIPTFKTLLINGFRTDRLSRVTDLEQHSVSEKLLHLSLSFYYLLLFSRRSRWPRHLRPNIKPKMIYIFPSHSLLTSLPVARGMAALRPPRQASLSVRTQNLGSRLSRPHSCLWHHCSPLNQSGAFSTHSFIKGRQSLSRVN